MTLFQYNELSREALLSRKQVQERLNVSSWTMRKLLITNDFPNPVKISEHISKWRKRDIEDWIDLKGMVK